MMQPWSGGQQLVDPNQTGAAREIRRDLIRPYSPILSADLIESDTDYHVHADLPGVEDLTIEIVGRTLVIKAERKVVHDTEADTVHSVERSFGKVQRQILLPVNADIDNAASRFVNGVLTVSFPKRSAGTQVTKRLLINTI
jgi:HSP20 family protein